MKEYGIFDIIGPVMIGPSSSHTAGAARLGYMARKIAGDEIKEVVFYLHGSFAKTYAGHGTDKALLAGVMGFMPDDEEIREAFTIARERGLTYRFEERDLGEVHPNTVKIVMYTQEGARWEITGSSIGGGKVKIIRINELEVDFAGEYTTLITYHRDRPGVIAFISSILANYRINVAFMRVFRENKWDNAVLIAETDEDISPLVLSEIAQNPHIFQVKVLQAI
ncbi:L-serine ammonia-lyase, iron-sulfur-dependent subunit beta [Dehalobacterium formicoaceticum]|uniref:L-serine deaminase n=1 Tax=Dehalobacterium formicoaceticum TaxID=51515 RepID=A0ABT1Y0N8_9FIRM|nr:L-serine ammonia-lyase, iron-sulfur-dependent subunit beta [Dehalobacterium formicoaceticum]MCR6544428.1 L-serine ammonia-lyase, iron-sulfur-dependent subunit beta [Dehalobacterium formicoaceticum]